MQFLVPLREIIYRGLARSYGAQSKVAAMNRAVSLTVRQAVLGDFPDLRIDPAKVQLSMGSLGNLLDMRISVELRLLTANWRIQASPSFNAFADDTVYVLAYNVQEKTVAVGVTERINESLTLDLSAEPDGSELLVYACAGTRDGKKFSNSQYLGEFSY